VEGDGGCRRQQGVRGCRGDGGFHTDNDPTKGHCSCQTERFLKVLTIVLSPIEEGEVVDQTRVTSSIREFFDSIGQGKNFRVISKSETIFIKSANGEKMNGHAKPVHSIRSCCGL